jgi:hypothetical protein
LADSTKKQACIKQFEQFFCAIDTMPKNHKIGDFLIAFSSISDTWWLKMQKKDLFLGPFCCFFD